MARHLAPLVALLALPAALVSAQQVSAGTGTIFMGSYSGHITAVDEATEAVTKIPLKTGARSSYACRQTRPGSTCRARTRSTSRWWT